MEHIHLLDQFNGGFEHTLILSYSHDLLFYEQVIHRGLRENGARNLILLVDASEHERTFRQPLQEAGLSYVVQPIRAAAAFHPKIVLLIGSGRGRLLVGSGNLTVPGYARNREVFTRWEYDTDRPERASLAAFRQVFDLVTGLRTLFPFRSVVEDRLELMMESAPWLQAVSDEPEPKVLLHNLREPLLDQIERLMEEEPVHRITALSPYFDNRCRAVESVLHRWQPQAFELITARAPRLDPKALGRVLDSFPTRTSLWVPIGEEPERYPHAKWLLLEGTNRSLLVAGSANLTAPALLQTAATGNIECVGLFIEASAEPIREKLLKPLSLQSVSPEELNCREAHEAPVKEGPSVLLEDALYRDGRLICTVKLLTDADLPAVVMVGHNEYALEREATGAWSVALRAIPEGALPIRVRSLAGHPSNAVWLHHQAYLDDALMSAGERADQELARRFALDPDGEILQVLLALERNLVFQRSDLAGEAGTRRTREASAANDPVDAPFEAFVDTEDEVFPEVQTYRVGSGSLLSEVMNSILSLLRDSTTKGDTIPSGKQREALLTVAGRVDVVTGTTDSHQLVRRRMERFVNRFAAGMSDTDFLRQLPAQVHVKNYHLLEDLNLLLYRRGIWGLPEWAAVALTLIEVFLPSAAELGFDVTEQCNPLISKIAARLWYALNHLGEIADSPGEMEVWRTDLLGQLTQLDRLVPLAILGGEPNFASELALLVEGVSAIDVAFYLEEQCPEHDLDGLLRKVRRLLGQKPDLRVEADRVTVIYRSPLDRHRLDVLRPLRLLGMLMNTRELRHLPIFVVYVANEGGNNPHLGGVAHGLYVPKGCLIRINALKTGVYMVDRRENVNVGYVQRAIRRASTQELVTSYLGRVGNLAERSPAADLVRLCGLPIRM